MPEMFAVPCIDLIQCTTRFFKSVSRICLPKGQAGRSETLNPRTLTPLTYVWYSAPEGWRARATLMRRRDSCVLLGARLRARRSRQVWPEQPGTRILITAFPFTILGED